MKKYVINGITYNAPDRYSLKVWARILEILRTLPLTIQSESGDTAAAVAILGSDALPELLSLILGAPIEGELYDNDVEDIQRAINDFFLRKNSLMSVSALRSSG